MFIGHYEPEVAKATTFLLNPASRRSVNACRAGFRRTSGQLFIRRSRLMPRPRWPVSGADLVDDLEYRLLRGLCEPAVDALLHARHQDGVPKGLPAGL